MSRSRTRSPKLVLSFCLALVLLGAVGGSGADAQSQPESAAGAGGIEFIRTIEQVVCEQPAYNGGFLASHFTRGDCIRVDFQLTGAPANPTVSVAFFDAGATDPADSVTATFVSGTEWRAVVKTDATWPSGTMVARVLVAGQDAPAGEAEFFHNALGADLEVAPPADGEPPAPGDELEVTGNVHKLTSLPTGTTQKEGAPATLKLRVVGPDGTVAGPYPGSGTITADNAGDFAFTIPAGATSAFAGDLATQFKQTVSIEAIDAAYNDPLTGAWSAERAGATGVTLVSQPNVLLVDNSFVSSFGWVKPGETYPFRVTVSNYTPSDATGAAVTVEAPDGARFTNAVPLRAGESATVAGDGSSLSWTIGSLAKAADGVPTITTLVVEGQAAPLSEDPQIVWKDISSTATLTYDGYGGPALTSTSHGPKVIPPNGNYETARYGDKPFPMVPVDYRDRKHQEEHTGDSLSRVVNDPEFEGSTFNLYQEMSYGQLFPEGTVPSAGIATAGFNYGPGFEFTTPEPTGNCRGVTFGTLPPEAYGSPLYPERIRNGWYQLPGDTEYYGGDFPTYVRGLVGARDSA